MSNEEIVAEIKSGRTDLIGELYLKNLGLIKSYIRQYSNDDNFDDLLQESYFAIAEAVKHWQPDHGACFMTYALFWIRNVVLRYLRTKDKSVSLPSFMVSREIKYSRFIDQYYKENGRDPTLQEISAATGFSLSQIDDIKTALALTHGCRSVYDSVPDQMDDSEDLQIIDTLIDSASGIDDLLSSIELQELKRKLWSVVRRLPALESQVIKYRYRYSLTLKDCSEIFGVSPERVRQIERSALKRIKEVYRKELQPFLNDYIYQQGLKATDLKTFRYTFESSVERAAIQLDGELAKYHLG